MSHRGCVVVVAEPGLRGRGCRTAGLCCVEPSVCSCSMVAGSWSPNREICRAGPSSWTLNRGWPCDFGLDGPGEIRDAWLGQSGAGDALPVLTEEEFRDLNGLFVPENAELRPGPSQPRHGRGKVFEVGARENARSESRSLVMGLSASRETSQFCGRRANKNQAPEGVEALIPEPHQHPSDCPEGYICLFESYFTEGGLWFPLPEFLTSYCRAFDIFEEVTSFSIGVKNPSMVCANSRRSFKIFYGATSRVRDWRKCFFFAKLSDVSVEDTNLSCVNIWNFNPGFVPCPEASSDNIFLSNLSLLCKRSALSWPHMLEHFIDCSPSCLRMGSCELPRYADQFDDDEELVCEDEPLVPIDEPIHEGSAEATDTVDVCVIKPEVPNKDRATEVAAARAGKKVLKETTGSVPFPSVGGSRSRKRDSSRRSPETGPSNVGKPPRHGTPIRNAVEGVDHSFSFNYDARDHMFHNDGSACAELARNVHGDFSKFPQVETLLAPDLYRDVCRQKFQEMSQTNRMVGFYEKKLREVMRERDLLKVALETARKSLATSRADRHYEKSREDAVAVERRKVVTEIEDSHALIERLRNYIIGLRAYSVPKYTLCQVKGVQECLETMIAKGTAIPEARMKILAKGRPIWQSKGRCDRGSRDSRKRPRPLPGAAERWGRRHRCVI
ncbi:hypothetical protein ISN44_Un171g000040 [Arabidopsis suecica]|uniref:Uncharacterized protein n=1 Tax=Arabidopsis suecica TaxID=45249 RepID=A0A8T1X968_ARASU|nr:hypothetical protein ISN44_Un171g000040 [Arabidopsis suecica]